MLKAMVFDMDGTITVLALPLEAMRNDTKEYYISRGLPPGLLEPADGISSSTAKAREYFLSNGLSQEKWSAMELEVDVILNDLEGSTAGDATELPGALEVVKKVRAFGLRTAILTNNGRNSVDTIMKNIPLDDYFDIIQTRHESPRPKPYPDGILKIVSELKVAPDEVVYVGDAMIDGVAAKRAGIEFWGVATGETSREVLAESGASHVFDSLSEILEELSLRVSD
jgi:HAD superfamily hydrolase (TIGR01549 family)